jgi:hypothetical protein
MKSKKFNKKLRLNKKTIADLNNLNLDHDELKKIYGGDPQQIHTTSKFGYCC